MTAPETNDQHTDAEQIEDNKKTTYDLPGDQDMETDTSHSSNMKDTQNDDDDITQAAQGQSLQEDHSLTPNATAIRQSAQAIPDVLRSPTLNLPVTNISEQHNVDTIHDVVRKIGTM